MAEGKGLVSWLKANAGAILIPLASGAIALVVSYGSSIEEETRLYNRVSQLEAAVSSLENQDNEFDEDIDDLEDLVDDKSRAVEQMVISEGRDLERSIIRLEGRVENLNRRLTFLDGIGGPVYGPTYENYSVDPSNDNMTQPSETE